MKALVCCAGDRTGGQFLAHRWLPGLRNVGAYGGDILVLDFDLVDRFRDVLKQDPHVFIEKASFDSRGREHVGSIRHEYYARLLKESFYGYDVVLCIDSDVVFQLPIQPLLGLAANDLCCVAERVLNGAWIKLVGDEEAWDAIKGKPMINCGMYAGPISKVVEVERFLSEKCPIFPVDQSWLNALVYFFGFPAKMVDDIWNFSRSYVGRESEGVFYTPEGAKVAIYHGH